MFDEAEKNTEAELSQAEKNDQGEVADVIHCPACETGQLRLRVGKFGKFWGCSNFPECKQTFKNAGTKPLMSAEESDAI